MTNKLAFTQQVVSQFSIWTVDDAMKSWWQTTDGGWRLTHVGFDAFIQCEIEHWDFKSPKMIPTPGLLLALDRKLTAPYYLHVGKEPRICFFGSKEATMYALYGDINKFVAAIKHF